LFAWTVFACSLNCIELRLQLIVFGFFFNFAVEKTSYLFRHFRDKIVVSHIIWKDLKFWSLKSLLNYLFVCFYFLFIQFSMNISQSPLLAITLVGLSGLTSLSNVPRSYALGVSLFCLFS